MIGTRPLLCSFVVTVAWAAAPAQGQSPVDRARRLYEEAEFQAAADAVGRAEAASGLAREDLVALLELRLLLDVATGEQARIREDALRLVSLAPDYRPGDEIPPEVREVLEAVRAEAGSGVEVRASAIAGDGQVTVDAAVSNDPAELTREIRVTTRVDAEDTGVAAPPVHLSLPAGATLRYFAEAVGPGGVVVARHGTPTEPLVFAGLGSAVAGGDDATPWIVTGVVLGVLLVAGGVVLGVVLASEPSQSELTRPTLPMVVGD